MQLQKNVYRISGFANVYLVKGDKTYIIDTGIYEDRNSILANLKKHTAINKIKDVFLTHLHFDHAGNADLFSSSKVYAPKKELEDFKKNPSLFFAEHLHPKTKEFILNHVMPYPEKCNGISFISVPGHTRGSSAIIDAEKKLLFSGDTLFFNGIGRTDFENSVPEKMPESLERLKQLIKTKHLLLCPGHNY